MYPHKINVFCHQIHLKDKKMNQNIYQHNIHDNVIIDFIDKSKVDEDDLYEH